MVFENYRNGIKEVIDRICDFDTSVLITGESGVGKEVIARMLHLRSARKAFPFAGRNDQLVTRFGE